MQSYLIKPTLVLVKGISWNNLRCLAQNAVWKHRKAKWTVCFVSGVWIQCIWGYEHYYQTERVVLVQHSSFLCSACTSHDWCGLIAGANQTDGEIKRAADGMERKKKMTAATLQQMVFQPNLQRPVQIHVVKTCMISIYFIQMVA